MPNYEFPIDESGLDVIILEELTRGKLVICPPSEKKEKMRTIHYDIKHLRRVMKDIYEVYSKNGTKEDFFKVLKKNQEKLDNDLHNFFSDIRAVRQEECFKVIKRKKKGNKLIIEFEKVNEKDKAKYIESIAKKLIKNMDKEQLQKLLEQSVRKLNDIETLKKVDKALDKKKPKLEEVQGCYRLLVNDIDLWLMN